MTVVRLIGACALSTALLLARPASALQLITKSEAALPPAPSEVRERGITRGPTLLIDSPQRNAGMLTSPVVLKIRFEAHGNSKIDVDSVILTYLKKPEIDLTQRVKSSISTSGIDVEDAEVPPGTHTLRIDVTDTLGHSSRAEFTFSVSRGEH